MATSNTVPGELDFTIVQGDQFLRTVTAPFDVSGYTIEAWVSHNGVETPIAVAVLSTTTFTLTLTAALTAAMPAGIHRWWIVLTSGATVREHGAGDFTVLRRSLPILAYRDASTWR